MIPRLWWLVVSVAVISCVFPLCFAEDSGSNDSNAQPPAVAPSGNATSGDGTVIVGSSFFQGFVSSISVILISELGDKTFFIAAIMAMRHPRLIVFAGAITALIIMTILSAGLGFATTVIPKVYTHYLSVVLFIFFGVRMLREAYFMTDEEGMEEFEEVQKSLNRREAESSQSLAESGGVAAASTSWQRVRRLLSRVFLQALTLTFVAEWGDRSQVTTIILAARENVYGVTLGAVLGHAICTSLAVIAGRLVAQKISVRTVTFIGGIIFLVFAVTSLWLGVDQETVTEKSVL